MLGEIISDLLMAIMAFLINGVLLIIMAIAIITLVDKIKEMAK